FTRGLVRDLLTFDLLSDAEIALVDINKQRLDFARRACQKIVDQGGYGAKVTATLNRRDALKGADAVCVTILSGSTSVWQHDILIPKYYGIDTNVGDTRGPSGIFRALRTIPEMVAIARDMEQLCPRAMMLNYTNPMAMLCHAMNRQTSIQLTGLCHSVQGTAGMIERWLKLKPGSMEYTCAGINHMAWYLSLEHRGRDLYPRLKKAMADKSVYDHEQVRNEMFLALGYYVTESSGHNSEYNWWFRKRPDLIKRYCRDGTGWNPGQYAYILKAYRNREGGGWQKSVRQWLNQDQVDLTRGHEYAASIINAYMGGDLYRFNGNVANNGLIDNLPTGACVEVPVLASSKGLEPVRVGSLPASVAMLTGLSAQIEMMAVDGSLKGDAELVYQAI
ncbi:MAG: alpha-glucosidase/alpha-galactosidase, partial [Candidatus Latescibacterota bacterium]|nr:alpha-glucosidase/alpha-galactosidase [Candidatus Latescibacterota bacterium]